MFKQLSQIGKNLSDEFARGVSEDLNPSQDHHTKDDSGLPPEVVSKLKKFEKYEDKYPKLLSAYKGERLKLERAVEIEKVLTEYTPISSFDDAESLAAFFKDMNEKQNLLNNEIKRLITEASEKNQVDTEEKSTSEPLNNGEYEKDINRLKDQILQSDVKHGDELKELNKKLQDTNENFEKLKGEKDSLVDSYEMDVSKLKEELERLKNEYENREKMSHEVIEKLDAENKLSQNKIKELEQTLSEKESTIKKLQEKIADDLEKIEGFEKKVNSSSEFSIANTENLQSATPSKSSAKKKKKSNKKSSPHANTTVEETPVANDGEHEKLETKYKEVCTKLESIQDNLNADWQGRYDALKVELNSSVHSNDELKEQMELLEKERKHLGDELNKSKDEIKEKQSEIEETRDMMKVIGNELVDAKDKLKELSGVDKEDMVHLEDELRKSRSELSSLAEKLTEKENQLQSVLSNMTRELDSLRTSSFYNEKQQNQLNENLNKLKTENSKLTDQVKEFENLKKTHSSLRTSLVQKEKTIIYLEQQIKTYTESVETTKKTTDSIKLENRQLLDRLETLKRDYEILKADAKGRSESFEKYIRENGQLSERLSMLQDKYETLQSLKSNSSEHTDSIKRQCEELTVKLKEANKKIFSLEDEVTEYSNMIHDKAREINHLRRHISENSYGETAKERELKEKLTYEADEKIKLQNELILQATRKSRDVQDWKQANAELKSELHGLQLKEKELQSDILTLKTLNTNLQSNSGSSKEDSKELEKLAISLKESLSKADQKIRGLQETNDNLMRTNDNVNEKFSRLSKNYKALSKQLNELKEKNGNGIRSSRASSVTSNGENQPVGTRSRQSSFTSNRTVLPPETVSEMNDKVAYIKNVLLGFLEHKDQRTQLLPVVSTLLRFDSNDEKRLMMSLK